MPKWQWNSEVFRNVPGSTVVKVRSPGAAFEYLVITMIGTSDTTYDVPAGYDAWYTDLIRVEAYDKNCALIETGLNLDLDVYAPAAPHLVGFRYGCASAADSGVLATIPMSDATVTEGSSHAGFFSLRVDASGDYMATTESACPMLTLDMLVQAGNEPLADTVAAGVDFQLAEDAKLSTVGLESGSKVQAVCADHYVRNWDYVCVRGEYQLQNVQTNERVALGPTTKDTVCQRQDFTADLRDSYFRLTHRSRLDFGWRIKEIEAFSDDACTAPVAIQVISDPAFGTDVTSKQYLITSVDGTRETYVDDAGALVATTYGVDALTDGVIVGTGAHTAAGPGQSGYINDGWWSNCLNCNPYKVDMTHGIDASNEDSVHVDFITTVENTDVRCVKVYAKAFENSQPYWQQGTIDYEDETKPKQYYPIDITLFRGKSTASGTRCSTSEVALDGFTEQWSLGFGRDDAYSVQDVDGKKFAVATFATTCGSRGHIAGELLSFEPNVPGACHCKQLCIDNAASGCRSWKWRTDSKACYLQTNIASAEVDCDDDADMWISGDTGLRLTHFTPSVAPQNSVFELTVAGYNLPNTNQDMPADRQRIKIVDATSVPDNLRGNICAEAADPPGVKGLRCVSGYICSPRPTTSTADSASWAGLEIQDLDANKDYKVCYNAGTVYDRYSWHMLAGTLRVNRAVHTFSVPAADITSQPMCGASMFPAGGDGGTDMLPDGLTRLAKTFKVAVSRPPFGSYSDVDNWRIRLVRSHYNCSARHDKYIASATTESGTGLSGVAQDVDTVHWSDFKCFQENTYTTKPVMCQSGAYKVCFSEKSGAADTFKPIPSSTGDFTLDIAAVDGDTESTATVYSGQQYSGRTGQDTKVSVKGFRLNQVSTGAIRLLDPTLYNAATGVWSKSCGDVVEGTAYASSQTWASVRSTPSSVHGANEYEFQVASANVVGSGAYKVCYCEEQSVSSTGDNVGTGEMNSYKLHADRSRNRAITWANRNNAAGAGGDGHFILADALPSTATALTCKAMCGGGCSGRDCHCEDYDDTVADNVLCLPPAKCKTVCEGIAACRGFETHQSRSMCVLLQNNGGTVLSFDIETNGVHYNECTDVYEKVAKKACTGDAHYSKDVGTLWMTSRPHVGADWVLTPGASQSLEVIGTQLNYFRDRITIISCNGTCGVSAPALDSLVEPYANARTLFDIWYSNHSTGASEGASPVTMPFGQVRSQDYRTALSSEYSDAMAFFNTWMPRNQFMDPPADNSVATGFVPVAQEAASQAYRTTANSYCPGGNLPATGEVAAHQCYAKCSSGTCVGANCHCDGHFYGYDGETSTALCLERTACQQLCADMDTCVGIDMHKTLPRCFLNDDSCVGATLNTDANYDYSYKVTGEGTRRMQQSARQLQEVVAGYSCEQILRFQYVKFRSGGTFKACFCDSNLLANPSTDVCHKVSDYKIDVGTIHVSGVSCLVSDSRFQRGQCVQQYATASESDQGLRCYTGTPPSAVCQAAAAQTTVVYEFTAEEVAPVLTSWCLYGPEEQTRTNAVCVASR